MKLVTSDRKRMVDIGSAADWISVYSTAEARLGLHKRKIPLAIAFLKTGKCDEGNGTETARQINLMRDEFAKLPPDKAVYDIENPEQRAPWVGNLSPVITSCANLFTTADGKDMLYEIVCILTYAGIKSLSVNAENS